MQELIIPSQLKKSYSLFYYFNVTSKDWIMLRELSFLSHNKLQLLATSNNNYSDLPCFLLNKKSTLFISSSSRKSVFNKNDVFFIDHKPDLKKKIIMNSICVQDKFYSLQTANTTAHIHKYSLLKSCLAYLQISKHNFYSTTTYFFLKIWLSLFSNYFLLSSNIQLIYKLFLYL